MADGLNRVTLLGNLGADPDLRFTKAGQGVLNLRIACSESWFDKESNERKERTEWVSVTVWGKRAEGLAKVLKKGDRICVEGSLRTSSYEKDGEKRYKTEVNATNIVLCGGSRGTGAHSDDGGSSHDTSGSPPDTSVGFGADDLPF